MAGADGSGGVPWLGPEPDLWPCTHSQPLTLGSQHGSALTPHCRDRLYPGTPLQSSIHFAPASLISPGR